MNIGNPSTDEDKMTSPVFSEGLEEDIVQRVGTRLQLQVTVEDQSEKVFFEWRGPSGLSTAEEGRVSITESGNTSTAEISPLHLQDQGIWTCSAKNKYGVTQTKCNVLAQVPKSYKAPVFLEELVAGLTQQGTVSLECKVVGIPSPSLKWFRDGEEIRSGDVFALQASMERPVSVYRCDAVNCMGTVASTAVLDVSKSLNSQVKVVPVLTEPLTDKKVKIGELVELSIAVSKPSLPVRVVWWNHGSQIAEGEKYSVVENSEGRFSVIINPVELCDDGEWRVTVDNQQGSVASNCTLTLRVPKNYRKPRFVENLKAVLTKEGLVSFECKVVGYPTPLLRWFKDGAELKPGDVYQLSGSRSLGTYSCLARNCMGEAVSTATLTVEDIGEKFPESKSELRFLVPLQDAAAKIGDKHRFSVQVEMEMELSNIAESKKVEVTYSPSLEIAWRFKDLEIGNSDHIALSKEDGGFYHCDIDSATLDDEGDWSVVAKDSGHQIETVCHLTITIPKHYKKPKFLEPLKAVLTEEGAVNLECKVIGVPQPTLSWYKDGVELKAGDIHRLMSGKDGSCCLGTYTCVATNCMGKVTSSAALLGFEDAGVEEEEQEQQAAMIAHDLRTPDISDGNIKPFSLSTIQEERTSQMMSPEAAQQTETIRQHSLEHDEEEDRMDLVSVISVGKVDEEGELSLSIGDREVTLSLYQTPDLSEKDAKNICEMFADELAESISESNYVELPPLRFTKETAKTTNIQMEAVIIDIDQQDLEEYQSMKNALENIDDLQTECDIEDVSIAEWNEDPVKGTEFETLACEEILDLDNQSLVADPMSEKSEKTKEDNVAPIEHDVLELIPISKVHRDKPMIISGGKSEVIDFEKEMFDVGECMEIIPLGVKEDYISEATSEEGFVLVGETTHSDIRLVSSESTSLGTRESEMGEQQTVLRRENISLRDITITDQSSISHKDKDVSDISADAAEIVKSIETSELVIQDIKPGVHKTKKESLIQSQSNMPVVELSDNLKTNLDSQYLIDVINKDASLKDASEKSSQQQSKAFDTDSEENELKQEQQSREEIISFNASSVHKPSTDKEVFEQFQQLTEKESYNKDDSKKDSELKNLTLQKEEVFIGDTLVDVLKGDHIPDSVTEQEIDFKIRSTETQDDKDPNQTKQKISKVVGLQKKSEKIKNKENKKIETNQEPLTIGQQKSELKEGNSIIDKILAAKCEENKAQEKEQETHNSEKNIPKNLKPESDAIRPTQIFEHLTEITSKVIKFEESLGQDNIYSDVMMSKEDDLTTDVSDTDKEIPQEIEKIYKHALEEEKDIIKSIESTQAEYLSEFAKTPSRKSSKKQQIGDEGDEILVVGKVPSRRSSKKQSRQESVADSEEVPDMETYDDNEDFDDGKGESKDLLEDNMDLDADFEEYKRKMRSSSYEKTLAGMDPELLAELGLGPDSKEGSSDSLDLSQLPTETTEERMSRIEEKAARIAVEDDTLARKSRSRSRSRSKSRPPNLDTVMEQRSREVEEARYYETLLAQPSLDTIKESPSTASMAGMLAGGFSSASVNTVLQASQSAASVNTIIGVADEVISSPITQEKRDHSLSKLEGRISEEKERKDTTDTLGTTLEKVEKKLDSSAGKKPKKKAQRSDTKSLLPKNIQHTDTSELEIRNNKVVKSNRDSLDSDSEISKSEPSDVAKTIDKQEVYFISKDNKMSNEKRSSADERFDGDKGIKDKIIIPEEKQISEEKIMVEEKKAAEHKKMTKAGKISEEIEIGDSTVIVATQLNKVEKKFNSSVETKPKEETHQSDTKLPAPDDTQHTDTSNSSQENNKVLKSELDSLEKDDITNKSKLIKIQKPTDKPEAHIISKGQSIGDKSIIDQKMRISEDKRIEEDETIYGDEIIEEKTEISEKMVTSKEKRGMKENKISEQKIIYEQKESPESSGKTDIIIVEGNQTAKENIIINKSDLKENSKKSEVEADLEPNDNERYNIVRKPEDKSEKQKLKSEEKAVSKTQNEKHKQIAEPDTGKKTEKIRDDNKAKDTSTTLEIQDISVEQLQLFIPGYIEKSSSMEMPSEEDLAQYVNLTKDLIPTDSRKGYNRASVEKIVTIENQNEEGKCVAGDTILINKHVEDGRETDDRKIKEARQTKLEDAEFEDDKLKNQKRAAEEKKIANVKRKEVEKFIADNKRATEEQIIAEEKRSAEEKEQRLIDEKTLENRRKISEEKIVLEQRRLAEEKRVAEVNKFTEEKRVEAEKRLLEEKKEKKTADERRLSNKRLEEEKMFMEEKRLAEEKRLEEENKFSEDKRLAEEKKLMEEKRIGTEKKILEERIIEEEKRVLEENKLAKVRKIAQEKKIIEEEKIANEKRIEDEKIAAEEKKKTEEKKRIHEMRITEEKKNAEERRLAEEKRLEDDKRLSELKRVSEDKIHIEEKRLAEEKKMLSKKKAEEKKIAEETRIADEKRIAEEKLNTEKKKIHEEEKLSEKKRIAGERRIAEDKRISEEVLNSEKNQTKKKSTKESSIRKDEEEKKKEEKWESTERRISEENLLAQENRKTNEQKHAGNDRKEEEKKMSGKGKTEKRPKERRTSKEKKDEIVRKQPDDKFELENVTVGEHQEEEKILFQSELKKHKVSKPVERKPIKAKDKEVRTEIVVSDDDSSEDLITLKEDTDFGYTPKLQHAKTSLKIDSRSSRVNDNQSLEGRGVKREGERKISNIGADTTDWSEYSSSSAKCKTSAKSPTLVTSDFHYDSYKSPQKQTSSTPDVIHKQDIRETLTSPTFDSRSRNISGREGTPHYRDTVEKSLQTSHNLMSVVTGSLVQTKVTDQQTNKRPPSSTSGTKARPTHEHDPNKEAAMRKKLELEKASVAGAVSDIMIKEVGHNWVSLCWNKPSIARGSPVITYKVESWLCGEGAFWVELGRTPIPQFDAFNLKPDKCYHFRVTARNKRGWGDSIMTRTKVDLSKPTHMPGITSDMDPIIKALEGAPVQLNIQVSGEPHPKVTWSKDGGQDIKQLPGVSVTEDDIGSHVDISSVGPITGGKYTVTAINTAGRVTKSVLVQVIKDQGVHEAYKNFRRWQSLMAGPLAPYMINCPRDRRIHAGGSIQLTCRVVSNPWPVVRWFKDGEQIIPDDFTRIYAEADFQHVQIDDVTLDHSGKYCVEAFNEFGSVRCHFTVVVDTGLDRYMPPFFTRELEDILVRKGNNLLLQCRVEAYPYIGVTWHQSGSKIRLGESDTKLIDEDGNVVLVLINVTDSHSYSCTIINEVAENSSTCNVKVVESDQLETGLDEDVVRHSTGPRFISWPKNQEVEEGDILTIECGVEGCNSLILSKEFLPRSIDSSLVMLTKKKGNIWSAKMENLNLEDGGIYFLTARNSNSEVKYPVVIKVKSRETNLIQVQDCAADDGVGAPRLAEVGPMLARDGDDVVMKTCVVTGQGPLDIHWTRGDQDVIWTYRVSPYNRPGCVGVKLLKVGIEDEGTYTCTVSNIHGQDTFSVTLLVDFAEQKESEVLEELCNCPMLDPLTPLMSWSNTPIGTPRRTPLPTPFATPMMTPRATPRSTPRATPRATPTPMRAASSRGFADLRSPSRGPSEDIMIPPPRRRFVQAPEIFSSFSNKQADEGSLVELKCFISCAPVTNTSWEKDNLPMMSGPQVTMIEKTGVRTLTIKSAKPGDAGNYRMTIANQSGTTSCCATVSVVKKKSSSSSYYYSSNRLSVPASPYSSLGRKSSTYSSYSSYRSTYNL